MPSVVVIYNDQPFGSNLLSVSSSGLRIMVAGAYLFDHDPVADDPHTVIYSCVGGDLWNSGLVLVAGRWA